MEDSRRTFESTALTPQRHNRASLRLGSPVGRKSELRKDAIHAASLKNAMFDPGALLAKAGEARHVVRLKAKQLFFSQGSPADCVFYLQTGRAKLTVVSESGKEATIGFLGPGDFVGEESIAIASGLRIATATAISACTTLRIESEAMLRVMHDERSFSDFF